MDNFTLEQLLDHRIVDTESSVNQILAILLADEGKFGFVTVILFVIIYFLWLRLLHKPLEEENEEQIP
jgi:hypothetical protein